MTFGVDAGPRESERVSPGVATRWRERIDDRDSVGPWITSTTDPPFAVPGRGLGWTRSLHRGECPHTVSRIGLGDSRFVFFPQSGRVLHLTDEGSCRGVRHVAILPPRILFSIPPLCPVSDACGTVSPISLSHSPECVGSVTWTALSSSFRISPSQEITTRNRKLLQENRNQM
jgi:hypothetical protein